MQQPPYTVPTKLQYLICQVFEQKAAGCSSFSAATWHRADCRKEITATPQNETSPWGRYSLNTGSGRQKCVLYIRHPQLLSTCGVAFKTRQRGGMVWGTLRPFGPGGISGLGQKVNSQHSLNKEVPDYSHR
jgi:hypothetical protein